MFGQSAMNWHGEARRLKRILGKRGHQMSAPPPKEKNDRKKLDAAKSNRETEDDLDQSPEATCGIAERQRQTCHDDDDHRDDLGNRTFD